jgi:hypothetical protein
MEEQLRDLVRTNGFESVFTTLKVLVTSEYERAKCDYDFLQTLVKPSIAQQEPESAPQPEMDDEVVELPDTKRISIKDGAKVRLPSRKAPKTTTT